MKFYFLLIFLTWEAFGGQAMITVLEAPLFRKESQESKIIGYVRKGQVIYIDERDLKSDVEENPSETFPTISKKVFYKTVDKNGIDAFILGEHIKIIYKDFREFGDKLPTKDPTDYRIAEPINDKFPFIKLNQPMVNLFFGIGPQNKTSYPYSQNIIYEQYPIQTGWGVNYFWPQIPEQSFRWGINGAFYKANRRFMLQNETKTYEQEGQFSLGPQMQFSALKGQLFEVSYIAGLNVNYTRTVITQQLTNGTEGERAFQGLGFVPQASVYLTGVELLWSVDLLFIIEAQLILPQTLKPTDSNPNNGSWNSSNSDYISVPFGGQVNFFLGFSSKI